MSTRRKLLLSLVALTALSLVVVASRGTTFRASLTPTAAPAATSYTLDDLFTRLTTNAAATEGSHAFAPAGTPAETLHTLKQVYDAIPTIVPGNIKSGVSYLGVTGTAAVVTGLGTGTPATASQILSTYYAWGSNGAVIQGGYTAPSAAHYPAGQSFADNGDGTISDASAALVWQKCPVGQTGSDCSGGSPSYLYQSDGETACAAIGAGWRLPTLAELLTIVDYSTSSPAINGTFFPNTPSNSFCASSPVAFSPGDAWFVSFFYGIPSYSIPPGSFVRCVRSAS